MPTNPESDRSLLSGSATALPATGQFAFIPSVDKPLTIASTRTYDTATTEGHVPLPHARLTGFQGMCHANTLARPALRDPHAQEESRIHRRRRADPRIGQRRQRRGLSRIERADHPPA